MKTAPARCVSGGVPTSLSDTFKHGLKFYNLLYTKGVSEPRGVGTVDIKDHKVRIRRPFWRFKPRLNSIFFVCFFAVFETKTASRSPDWKSFHEHNSVQLGRFFFMLSVIQLCFYTAEPPWWRQMWLSALPPSPLRLNCASTTSTFLTGSTPFQRQHLNCMVAPSGEVTAGRPACVELNGGPWVWR